MIPSNLPERRQRPDAGVVILYVAIFLLVSLWFVSLAIDVGKVMAARTELQATADAAALAGASAIDPETGEVVQDSARVRAAQIALGNRAYEGVQTPVVIDPINDVDFPAPNQVRVRVHRTDATGNPVILHFAQTLGLPHVDVTADATAEAQELNQVCEHLAPFAPQVPPSGDFSPDCDSIYTLKLGSGGGQASAPPVFAPAVVQASVLGGRWFEIAQAGGNGYGQGGVNGGNNGNAGGNGNGNGGGNGNAGGNGNGNGGGNGNGNGGGTTSSGNGGGGGNGGGNGGGGGGGGAGSGSGNFQLLDFPDCNEDEFTGGGANAVAYYTLNGYGCCIGIGDEFVLTEPGNKVGPFRSALQDRWDADTDHDSHCYQEYTGNDKRVFLTPIIDTFQDANGKKWVKIVKFAAFFLRQRPNGDMVQNGVTGQFIKYIAPGNAGGPPVNTGIYGVHLVE